MNVNKLPFLLPMPSLCFPAAWIALLRNELYHRSCSINNYSILWRRSASGSSSARRVDCDSLASSSNHFSLTNCLSNPNYRYLSRYSASTIMRPHTKSSFSFNDYDVIGFDLDGTILRYNLDEMVPMEYELLCRYLVEHKGYSKQLLRFLDKPNDIDFLQKGLFLDTERGNLLKLDNNGCILKANHGTRLMTDAEITAVYGEERQWSVTKQFINEPLCAWNGPLADKMRSLLDYFDISVSLVFAHAIDEIDASRTSTEEPPSSYTVWPDVLAGLIHIYTRENFSNGKSGYFESLKNDPDRFLLKTSPVVIDWLRQLKASNKKLFLLTGSHIDFANFTASYALGSENWKDLFDVVICFAKKPGFFFGSKEFHAIEGFEENSLPIALDGELHLNKVYSMGNWKQLQNLFAQSMNIDVNKIKSLYVGDNLIQDVYAPEALANMDSVAISEEMISESSGTEEVANNFKNIIASRYWKSYFYEDGVPTLWTHIIAKHSKICVPTLEHAASKPIDYKFKLNNEIGFYPSPPVIVEE